jgi:hypothetical protein
MIIDLSIIPIIIFTQFSPNIVINITTIKIIFIIIVIVIFMIFLIVLIIDLNLWSMEFIIFKQNFFTIIIIINIIIIILIIISIIIIDFYKYSEYSLNYLKILISIFCFDFVSFQKIFYSSF